MSLQEKLVSRLSAGLRRRSIDVCSKWACSYRYIGKPEPALWSFKNYPWTRDMHDSTTQLNVCQKAAQMGFTETALNRVFFKMDVLGVDCLYLLPAASPDARDFSAARFDPAIEMSPHLKQLFSNIKNIGHKQAGNVNLYVRGSRSKSQLKSVPVGHIVFDEVDEMMQENIPLAFERTSGQAIKQFDMISTPTIDGFGINGYYNKTSQEIFSFPCPSCGVWTDLVFPDCLVITAESLDDPRIRDTHLICKECKNVLDHNAKPEYLAKGKWIPMQDSYDARGFTISQLYSMTVSPPDIAKLWFRAQNSPADEQEFYNSKLGKPHIVAGSTITDAEIIARIGDYKKEQMILKSSNRLRTMGIDVGKWLHIEICDWLMSGMMTSDLNTMAKCKVVADLKVETFNELNDIMRRYQVDTAVIDAQPETRAARQFADDFPGRVFLCRYSATIGNKAIVKSTDPYDPMVSAHRTTWLDQALGRFFNGTITLPKDISQEYQMHLKNLVRVYIKDADGNPVSRYITKGTADHYGHARNYAEIALPLAASILTNRDIKGFL